MSKFRKQDTSEEQSWAILFNSYDPNFFLINNWFIKDKYPDVDGQIRLRNPNGLYLNRYLHCQTKGIEKFNPQKFYIKREYLDYLNDTNVPTIFFAVDNANNKVFWFYLDPVSKKQFHLNSDNKGRHVDISKNELTKNNSAEVNNVWQKFAKKDNYQELNDSINEIVAEFHKNIRNAIGLIYLLRRIEKEKINVLFSKLLSISENESKTIIEKLDEKGILSKTTNLYLVENVQLGIDCLFDLIETAGIDNLTSTFKDLDDVKAINRQLAKIQHPKVDEYLKEGFNEIFYKVRNSKSNDEIDAYLEILKEISYRNSKLSLEIINSTIYPSKVLPTKIHRTKYGSYSGKSHEDLVDRSLDILDDLRYLEPLKTFKLLLKLSKNVKPKYKRHFEEDVKHLAEYNLEALKLIGYTQQLTLLNEIEKLSDKQLVDNTDYLLKIMSELLEPSFEGRSMSDYRTLVWTSGGLKPTDQLKGIRNRTIKLLMKMFGLIPSSKEKVSVLKTLRRSTDTPTQGNYSNELKDLIKENSEQLIKFNTQNFNSSEDQIAQEIEEQVISLIRRYGNKGLSDLGNLEMKIASDGEYELFRVFVGYDGKLAKDRDWQKVSEERKKKIQEYVKGINSKNYNEWVNRIKKVAQSYEGIDPSKYQYFFEFLYELGKQKPEIAYKLVSEQEDLLDKFLYHPLFGIWESPRNDLGKQLVEDWLNHNKHISICATLLANSKTYEKDLIGKVAKIATQSKDIMAMNNIINACSKHLKKDEHLIQVFIKCIQCLTLLRNTSWINGLWFRDKTLLSKLKEEEIELVFDNLIYTQAVDYYVEEILLELVNKYPEKIIEYFQKRLHTKKPENERYEKLPYRMHELDVELRKQADRIVPLLLYWLNTKDGGIKIRAAHFFNTLFPTFDKELETPLIKIIQKKNREELDNILLILESYDGEIFLHNAIKEILKNYVLDKDLRSSLFVILSNTGTVTGEYGMAEAYKRKRDEIQDWEKSADKRISGFAEDYEKSIDQLIEAETKKADDMITLMKKGLS